MNASDSSHQLHHSTSPHGDPIGLDYILLSHAYLGTGLAIYGLWMWIHSLKKCFTDDNNNGHSPAWSALAKTRNLSITRGLSVIAFSIAGIIVEAITVRHGRNYHYAYHPLYAASFFAGTIDIISATRIHLIEDIQQWAYLLPFVFQGYFMRAQAYGQPHLTGTCHMLTSYLGFAIAFMTLLDHFNEPKIFLFTWIKCLGLLLEGTWLWHSGVVLSPTLATGWLQTSHDHLMLIVVEFACHILTLTVLMLASIILYAKAVGQPLDRISPSEFLAKENKSPKVDRRLGNNKSGRPHEHVQYTRLLNANEGDLGSGEE